MAYVLSDIRTKVLQRVRDTGYSTTETTNYLNDTINDVYNEYRLPFMQTTQTYTLTIGNSDITAGANLPANFVQAIDLISTGTGNEYVIPYIDSSELDRMYPDQDDTTANPTSTSPLYWYKYASTIRVFPAPKTAYTVTLRYYKMPTALADDNNIPELPSPFEELLVVGAAYRILQVKDNYDQAAILQNKYDEILAKLVVRFSQPQVGTPRIMPINRGYMSRTSPLSFKRG